MPAVYAPATPPTGTYGARIPEGHGYVPSLDEEEIARLRAWHEDAYREIKAMLPARSADGFGEALLREVRPTDRVLDMGTGSGINAILAARLAHEVVAVDVNPSAVEAARSNARRPTPSSG